MSTHPEFPVFRLVLPLLILILLTNGALATLGYYRTYTVFGSGDNMISTFSAHGGPGAGHAYRKWNVECLDGEAVIGVISGGSDFQSLGTVWCKFMFPYKPPTNGIYPYYPNCYARNMTVNFFCYNPRFHDASVDTFITGFWDNEFAFNIYRASKDDIAPYKCCKAPTGYYVDYSSCYYAPTHDQYWEYYDAPAYFIVYCATGYAMTGISKKINPFSKDYHIDWFQCCRLGFGSHPNIPPPPINYDYYYPSNVSSYASGESRPSYTGASARSLFHESDGTMSQKMSLQDLSATNGRIAAITGSSHSDRYYNM